MEKKMSMGRYILHEGAILLALCSLIFLLASCEKDISGIGKGEWVTVKVSLTANTYDADPAGARSSVHGKPKSETTLIALEENRFLYTTLSSDPVPDELRGTGVFSNLDDGQRICVAAYDASNPAGTLPEACAKFTYTGGGLVPDASTPVLKVEKDKAYVFVAYSYGLTASDNTPAAYPPTDIASITDINLANDLIYGYANATITQTNQQIGIPMSRKLARVRVVFTTTDLTGLWPITAISGVSVGSAKKHTLTLQNGNFTAGAVDETQSIGFPVIPGGGLTTLASNYHYVYPSSASPTEVGIGSVSLNGTVYDKTYTDQPLIAKFNTALVAGGSYTLTIDLKELYWAGSNIYWDNVNNKLTFDAPGSGASAQRKQGVFFQWGSLVGISPALTNGSRDYSINTPVYIPEYNSANPAASGWSRTNVYAAFADIPYVDDNYTGSGSRDDNYLSNDARNTDNDYAYWNAKKGDICRYISENGFGPGGRWRMPVSNEFGASLRSIAYNMWSYTEPKAFDATYWERQGDATWTDITTTAPTDAYGTYTGITAGGKFYNTIFPVAGTRGGSGILQEVGHMVGYWWSSAYSTSYAGCATIQPLVVGLSGLSRFEATPIRCVKNE